MKEANKSIVESLKSGQYFQDAKSWYLIKFINPYVERNILVIFFLFFIVSIFIALFFYQNMITEDKDQNFLAFTDDITYHYSEMKDMGSQYDNPDSLIQAYLCNKFVIIRESFDTNKIDLQTKFIMQNSVNQIASDFIKYITIDNPNSPVLLYTLGTTRMIEIISSVKSANEANTYIIKYRATLLSPKDNTKDQSMWVAIVKYATSPIEEQINQKRQNVEFKVIDYKVKKVD
jgi:type IV secretory pathway component VirB8